MARKKDTPRAGRPRRLDDQSLRADILSVLRASGSRADAAAKIGVAYNTLQAELRRDPAFKAEVIKAEHEAKISCIARITKASNEDWKAAAWLLERKYFREYGKQKPDAVTHDQMATAFSRLVAVVLSEIPKEYHEPVRIRIEEIIVSLRPNQ